MFFGKNVIKKSKQFVWKQARPNICFGADTESKMYSSLRLMMEVTREIQR